MRSAQPQTIEVELLILTGSVKLIQDYPMPLTLGNECAGIVEQAGSQYDRAAQKQGKEYRFVFVRSHGAQLQTITGIVEKQQVRPAVDSRIFSLDQANEALRLVAKGQLNGKVMIQL